MLRQGPNIVSHGSSLAPWPIVTHTRSVDGSPCHDPADAPAFPSGRLQTEPTSGGSCGPGKRRPRRGAGPVRGGGGSHCGQRELSSLCMLTWPDRPAVGAVAVIVDMLVNHTPGGAERVDELAGTVARPQGGGVHLAHFSHVSVAAAPGTIALFTVYACSAKRRVCAASAQPQCRLAGAPLFQLAAMARTATWGTLTPCRALPHRRRQP
jgi:hypothetical protein